jgi:arsenite-transporting ATPase
VTGLPIADCGVLNGDRGSRIAERGHCMRIMLYTGKGGVGKTSAAAATALRCAQLGYRTVVLSTDAAHSLADSFETELGPEPVPVAPNLWGQEVDVHYSIDRHWSELQRYMAAVFSWRGVGSMLAEEIAVIPGMEEGASLLWVNQHYQEGKYDVIIVDCAPTAETLRLLGLPDVGRWWFQRLFPIGRRAALTLGPIARPFLDNMPMPDNETFEAVEKLFDELDKIHQLLTNSETSSMRLVVNPEKMVIKEAQRTYTYLNLYGYVTDAVICNRVIPSNAGGSYFDGWLNVQGKYLQMIEEAFSPIPMYTAPYFEQEVAGIPMLRRLADALFPEQDPSEVLFHGQAYRIESSGDGYALIFPLPFTEKKDVSLLHRGDELSVQAGAQRRSFVLPRVLAERQVQGAKFEGHELRIRFE